MMGEAELRRVVWCELYAPLDAGRDFAAALMYDG